jgi:hypothetical protein
MPIKKIGTAAVANLGCNARRDRGSVSLNDMPGALATKQSSLLFRRSMDCFAYARNDELISCLKIESSPVIIRESG